MNNPLNRLWESLKKLKTKGKIPTGHVSTQIRTVDDIIINVTEGLGDSREIQVKAWNPDLARMLFWEIRAGLQDKAAAEGLLQRAQEAVIATNLRVAAEAEPK